MVLSVLVSSVVVKFELLWFSVVVWFFLLVLIKFWVIIIVFLILGVSNCLDSFLIFLICGVFFLNLLFVCNILCILKFMVLMFCFVSIEENISDDICFFIESSWFFKLLWWRIFLWNVKFCILFNKLLSFGLIVFLFFNLLRMVSLILIMVW